MVKTQKKDFSNHYKGLEIHATMGVHKFTIQRILELHNGKKGHVLDLACGSGAFTQRAIDNGFKTTSVDFSAEKLALDTEYYNLNLNKDFAKHLSHNKYDFIIALEIIEHLENPYHFLRQIRKIASPKTVIFISFPNIHLWLATRSFIEDGTFINWNIDQYWNTKHHTILTDWLFEQHLIMTGLKLINKYFPSPLDVPRTKMYLLHKFYFELICLLSRKISRNARMSDAALFEIVINEDNSKNTD